MDILIIDIKGKFAHFRKFYTNSSSLSYSIPPKTTIAGILAAILGYERDSYYDIFSKENLNVGIKRLTNTRKILQNLNYIKAENENAVINPKAHTQIPFEIVTSSEYKVVYRIYINHQDKEILNELEYRIKNHKYYFSPYLGAAPFNCNLEFIARTEGCIKEKDEVFVDSIINKDKIEDFNIDLELYNNLFLVNEKMPSEILKGRVINKIDSYIYDENNNKLKVKLNCNYINLNYINEKENIVFM